MTESRLITCRAGYSTIMDLFKLQKNAVLIPTPGQTEQEYLSKYLSESRYFKSINQNEINLKNLRRKIKKQPMRTKKKEASDEE